MAVTVTNLVMGPGDLWVGTFGATEPADADAAPGVGWTNVGGTTGGTKVSAAQSYSDFELDQLALPAGARMTKQAYTMSTTLAEVTLANLRIALNQTADAGTTLSLPGEISNADPNYQAALLVTPKPGGGNRLVILRRVLSTANMDIDWTKDKQSGVPLTFTAYYVSPTVDPIFLDETPGA